MSTATSESPTSPSETITFNNDTNLFELGLAVMLTCDVYDVHAVGTFSSFTIAFANVPLGLPCFLQLCMINTSNVSSYWRMVRRRCCTCSFEEVVQEQEPDKNDKFKKCVYCHEWYCDRCFMRYSLSCVSCRTANPTKRLRVILELNQSQTNVSSSSSRPPSPSHTASHDKSKYSPESNHIAVKDCGDFPPPLSPKLLHHGHAGMAMAFDDSDCVAL